MVALTTAAAAATTPAACAAAIAGKQGCKLVAGDADWRAIGFIDAQFVRREFLRKAGEGLVDVFDIRVKGLDGGDDGRDEADELGELRGLHICRNFGSVRPKSTRGGDVR